MFFFNFRRSRRRPRTQLALYLTIALVILDFVTILRSYSRFSHNLAVNTITHLADLPRNAQNQQIFICAQFWTSADVIAEFWLEALISLIRTLGPDNVYASLIVSGSLDNTAEWIRYLDQRLELMGVDRTVVLDPKQHKDAIEEDPLDLQGKPREGWIITGEPEFGNKRQLRRIPYLSKVRNDGLAPMLRIQNTQARTFDKVLFLNDVDFKPADVLTLLGTNQGNYDVACALDFHLPPALYDTFAARDTDGIGPVMTSFPYFRSAETRNALLEGKPARVRSCWNGIMLMDAAPFYPHLAPSHDGIGARFVRGLQFRGVSDSLALHHVEASECCLIHADLIATDQARKGLFINPAVRVGYERRAYELTHLAPDGRFISLYQYIAGVWSSRLTRWKTDGVSSSAGQRMSEVYKRIRNWQKEGSEQGENRAEVGGYCTILEMHILIDIGWKHVW